MCRDDGWCRGIYRVKSVVDLRTYVRTRVASAADCIFRQTLGSRCVSSNVQLIKPITRADERTSSEIARSTLRLDGCFS